MRPSRHASPFILAVTLSLSLGAGFGCSSSDKLPADGSAGGSTGAGGSDGGGTGGATATDGSVMDAPADSRADAGGGFDTNGPDSAASVTLTSTVLAAGATFPSENTCAGINVSPPLTWTAGPAGTVSYSVALTDLSINAVHWIIWDIPAGTTSLPAMLPGDTTLTTPVIAKQLHRFVFFGAGGAYRGPCPSGSLHTYQFEVNAIGSATLAGVTGASTSDQIQALAQAASLAHGDLAGTSNATAPPADASAGQ
jgi:Raf kinase inhibitor-like YbhB/YbcL family protein